MSGMKYYSYGQGIPNGLVSNEPGEILPEAWDTLKNGSRRAALAGHGQPVAKEVHILALDLMHKRGLSYESAESLVLSTIGGPAEKIELNASLDKWSQPMRPGPNLGRERTQSVAAILKAKNRKKSSKNKHPKNYTPPKKKRK